jgi:excisionase family DNA binding protein
MDTPNSGFDAPRAPLLNSISQTTTRLGIGRSKLYELIAAGDIHVIKIGGRTLVSEQTLQSFITKLEAR